MVGLFLTFENKHLKSKLFHLRSNTNLLSPKNDNISHSVGNLGYLTQGCNKVGTPAMAVIFCEVSVLIIAQQRGSQT